MRRLSQQEVDFLKGESFPKPTILPSTPPRPPAWPTEVYDQFDEDGQAKVPTTHMEAMLEAVGRNPGEGTS